MMVKSHVPHETTHYTCTCGWHGDVRVSPDVVAAAEKLLAERSARPKKVVLGTSFREWLARLFGWNDRRHSS
jgi:hypothetical protein